MQAKPDEAYQQGRNCRADGRAFAYVSENAMMQASTRRSDNRRLLIRKARSCRLAPCFEGKTIISHGHHQAKPVSSVVAGIIPPRVSGAPGFYERQ